MGAAPRLFADPGAFDATIDAVSLAGTLVAPSSPAASHAPSSLALSSLASTGGGGPASRTTVLPRLEVRAGAPQLVHSDRPRYQAQGVLGAGGVGEVVKTLDNDIDRVVAVKRLRADMRSPGHLARFVEEIRTVGMLEHPNIVPIHDVGIDADGYFFVMKYVEGETLESILDKLQKGDPLYHAHYGFERRVEIFTAILEAVSYAHARGILHRDLKPANVMVGPFGEVVVMDWGIAQCMSAAGSTAETGLVGTPAYMSPEQARGERLDVRSDIYALSVMFHELLCLQHYLDGKATMANVLLGVMTEVPKSPSFVVHPHQSRAPMDLTHFVRKGYEKDPAKRYQTVDEMVDRLRRRAEGYIPIQCHVTFLKRVTLAWTHFLDRHPLLVTAVMVLFVLWTIASGLWLGLRHGG